MEIQEFRTFSFIDKINYLEEWKNKRDFKHLIMAFEDHDRDVCIKACEMTVSLGKDAIIPLKEALGSKNNEVRSWVLLCLAEIEETNLSTFFTIVYYAFFDPNIYVRKKGLNAIIISLRLFYKNTKDLFEFLFYFVIISIVQLVTLLFFVLPLVVIVGIRIPDEYLEIRNFIIILLVSAFIPFISGFISSYLYKGKHNTFLFSALIGVIQSIPYNIILLLLSQKIGIINCFVPFFGFFGGLIGFHFSTNRQVEEEALRARKEEMLLEEEEKTVMHLIYERVKSSKKLQDQVILTSGVIGLVLLVYLSYSIYNISSISSNKKQFNLQQYTYPFPGLQVIEEKKD